jgi:two-component system, NarL family, nitrate/nitrite response regulator NarL
MKTSNRKKLVATSENQGLLNPEKEALLKVLVRQVVRPVSSSTPCKVLPSTEQIVNEVILESEVDGVHYCLVRCSQPTTAEAEEDESAFAESESISQGVTATDGELPDKVNLSPREIAIAKLVAQGLPNKSIGRRLDISPWTVATHLRRIFVKLGVSSRTAMITQLLEKNLLHG